MSSHLADYTVVSPDAAADHYADSDVPGEFRPLTELLGAEQLALTCIRIPAHSDFEQGTGHYHEEIEELYLITRGTLTMRFGEEIRHVSAPAAVRVSARTPRSHRNEGEEPVEMWAVSRHRGNTDAVKLDAFWEASPSAAQHR